MDAKLEAELRAAGYTDAQIAKERAYLNVYMPRMAAEVRSRRDCNYGLYHAGENA